MSNDPETELGLTHKAAEAPQAWSAAEDYPDDDDDTELWTDDDRGTTFWLRLFVGILAVVAVILAAVLWYVASQRSEPTVPAAVPVAAAPIPSPDDSVVPSTTVEAAPTPPPVIAAPPPVTTEAPPPVSLDDQYLAALRAYGITTTQNTDAEIRVAHVICQDRANGMPPDRIASAMMPQNPGMNVAAAQFVVAEAIHTYCPGEAG